MRSIIQSLNLATSALGSLIMIPVIIYVNTKSTTATTNVYTKSSTTTTTTTASSNDNNTSNSTTTGSNSYASSSGTGSGGGAWLPDNLNQGHLIKYFILLVFIISINCIYYYYITLHYVYKIEADLMMYADNNNNNDTTDNNDSDGIYEQGGHNYDLLDSEKGKTRGRVVEEEEEEMKR